MVARPKPTFRPECLTEIRNLPTENLRRRALQISLDVARGDVSGAPLENHPSTGDLSDCFKVYFDENDDQKPRYRLVYRHISDTVEAVSVEVVAVGQRRIMQVYVDAAKRLGRLTTED